MGSGVTTRRVGPSAARAVDPQRAESDRVGRDAGVSNAVDDPLDGERPLPLGVEVAVDARGHPGTLQPGDARARPAVLVERRVMPEDLERHARGPQRRRGLEGMVE
jgi:hypothetical protein